MARSGRLRFETPAPQRGAGPRRIALLVFPGVEALDVSGPAAVFCGVNRLRAMAAPAVVPAYDVQVIGPDRRPIRTADGLRLLPDLEYGALRGRPDTVLVAGGPEVDAALRDPHLLRTVARLGRTARRIGSVCTGSFVLAAAGLLDGRRATTHWAFADRFATRFPAVHVDAEPIYIRDGNVYSSAGVSAGMDLALALVEEDLGRDVALEVARALVLYLRRPGGQSQFSALLHAEAAAGSALRDLQIWISRNPDADLPVPALARRAAMSPRNFARVFRRDTGTTPARFVERLRVDAARRRLEGTAASVKEIARACGFGSVETMRVAFLRTLGVPPSAYRERFHTHS
jgi:transcriptional regulator GlxA family with amidase domain